LHYNIVSGAERPPNPRPLKDKIAMLKKNTYTIGVITYHSTSESKVDWIPSLQDFLNEFYYPRRLLSFMKTELESIKKTLNH
jgi:hypothetical protein